MKKLVKFYQRSSWHAVYNSLTTSGRARSNLLAAIIVQAVVSGFSGGIFYTGLLVGYGINIVNISILSVIPSICSVFSLLSPLVLGRFRRRRVVLSVTRILYYVINILGITLLPQFIHTEFGRIAGLIGIVFVSNSLNFIFSPGYSPWHMHHITEDIRVNYFSSTTLVSFISSSTVLILASLLTDRLTGDAQLNLIIVLRYAAFAVALLDVYFLQKPKEPEYKVSTGRLSLLKVIRTPLSNRKFMLTMLVYALHVFSVNLSASVLNTWLLEDVKVSYLYINIINAIYCIFIPATTPIWSKLMRKQGTFVTLAVSMLLHIPTFIAYAYVNHGNYLWLMTLLRLGQHCLGMGLTFSVNNLIYVNLPETDQDSYISLYNLVANGTNFLTMTIGTAIVAAMGTGVFTLFGHSFGSIPVLLLLEAVLYFLVPMFIFFVRPWVDPMAPSRIRKKKQ